uniref:Uncharacterized protein n=1 Tax=viral metagenome TaxID=1070528 RepID=A0A6M3L026_9ZZZZ
MTKKRGGMMDNKSGRLREENKILWKHNKQRAEEIKKLHTYGDIYEEDYHNMKDERDEFKNKYHELIRAVGNKYKGETRHETALRYIKIAEQSLEGQVGATTKKSREGEV